ncbi:MAG: TolC family protein [Candidatus Omnitrophota bacterium]|jgi:outer membrane protein TolC
MKRVAVFCASVLLVFAHALFVQAQEVLTWQDCLREAQKNHPDLISAHEFVKQTEAAKSISKSALAPQVNASLDASRSMTTTSASSNKTKKTANSFQYGASASQLLFDGEKTNNEVSSAGENIKAAQYNFSFISSEVRLRLRTAFIDLLKAQELLNLTQEIYSIRRSNLELITLRYESGMEHKGALLTAQANLAQSEFEITQNKRAFEVAQSQLTKEIGRNGFSLIKVLGDFNVHDAVLEKPDLEALAGKHPSLGKSIAQKNSASFSIKAAQANYFPQLSIQAAANRTGARFLPQNDQLDAGLVLSFPLFEGGLRSAQVAQAKAIYNQAEADQRSTRDSIIVGLQQSWAALQDALETVAVERKFLAAVEERSKIAEAQYSLGLIQFDTWTIIEDDLVSRKKVFLNAEANALLAEAYWVQAKGEILEYAP